MKRLCFFCLILLSRGAKAQTSELLSLVQTIESANHLHQTRFFAEKQDRVALKVLVVPLRFYKSVLSGQLAADCQFEPTCSVYGYQSLGTYGPIPGILATADRLMRCSANAATAGGTLSHFNSNGKIIDYPAHLHTAYCLHSEH